MEYLPLAIPAIIAAALVYGRWKYGSWTGSFMRRQYSSHRWRD